jgi:hypothetical protein
MHSMLASSVCAKYRFFELCGNSHATSRSCGVALRLMHLQQCESCTSAMTQDATVFGQPACQVLLTFQGLLINFVYSLSSFFRLRHCAHRLARSPRCAHTPVQTHARTRTRKRTRTRACASSGCVHTRPMVLLDHARASSRTSLCCHLQRSNLLSPLSVSSLHDFSCIVCPHPRFPRHLSLPPPLPS